MRAAGDLAEIGHGVVRSGASPVLGGRGAAEQVEDAFTFDGAERVDDGPPGLFAPRLRAPVDGCGETSRSTGRLDRTVIEIRASELVPTSVSGSRTSPP